MDKFVAALNVDHLTKQIADEPDPNKRAALTRILAEETAKLAEIEARRQKAKAD
jgi:hypothetical protein